MTHETAGDPVSGLKWTRRTTAKIADELRGLGIHVCPQTVARLLKAMGYSLRVNHKKLAGASNPNRDQQFRHITDLRERCAADNGPLISVDTKKKELVGTFRNPGAKWDRSPELTCRAGDHHRRSRGVSAVMENWSAAALGLPALSSAAPAAMSTVTAPVPAGVTVAV